MTTKIKSFRRVKLITKDLNRVGILLECPDSTVQIDEPLYLKGIDSFTLLLKSRHKLSDTSVKSYIRLLSSWFSASNYLIIKFDGKEFNIKNIVLDLSGVNLEFGPYPNERELFIKYQLESASKSTNFLPCICPVSEEELDTEDQGA